MIIFSLMLGEAFARGRSEHFLVEMESGKEVAEHAKEEILGMFVKQ